MNDLAVVAYAWVSKKDGIKIDSIRDTYDSCRKSYLRGSMEWRYYHSSTKEQLDLWEDTMCSTGRIERVRVSMIANEVK